MSFDRVAFADKILRSMEHLNVDKEEVGTNTGISEARLLDFSLVLPSLVVTKS